MIAVSAGNHAQALAYCSRRSRASTRSLVMWRTASPAKIEATRGYGAEVDLEASGPGEVFERLAELQRGDGPHARASVRRSARRSRARERSASRSSRTCPDVDVVVVPVGGGGLISGIATGAARTCASWVSSRCARLPHGGARGRRARCRSRRNRSPTASTRRSPASCRWRRAASAGRDRAGRGGGDRGRDALPLRAREARLRAGGSGGRRRAPEPEKFPHTRAKRWSASSRAATSRPQTAAAILARR